VNPVILSILNQFDEQTTVKFFSLSEIRVENNDQQLLERIDRLERKVLTSDLTFPLENERTVTLHAHAESNETDTKIDDELRQQDVKDFVLYRKFAKIAIRCFVNVKSNDAKNVVVSRRLSFNIDDILFILIDRPRSSLNIVLSAYRRSLVRRRRPIRIRQHKIFDI
jgi:hypothetical protein